MRDLWRMKGQAIAIALVIALGVLMQVMMDGLVNSLDETRQAYYERYRLADVFAPVKRAPEQVSRELAGVPGVASVETRVNGGALVDLPGRAAPVRAQAVSLPDFGAPRLNDVYLAEGRRIDPARHDEILLLQGFARAHDLGPGDTLSATMNGARRRFEIVGLAEAPEFVYTPAPGELAPDDSRFAVIWMSETALQAAFDLDGAFNEALVSLTRQARVEAVLDAVDRILAPYGSTGAYGLDDQMSNRFLSEEISGLRVTSASVPPVFLAVSAFLLYIVISRMIQQEREEIGLLKAFGYSSLEVSAHYFKLVMVIAVGGALLGCAGGVATGRSFAGIYQQYYKFPFFVFKVDPPAFAIGVSVSILSAAAGGAIVLRRVFALTPAVAMRPPAPADYSRTVRFGGWVKRHLDQPSRMVLRRLIRQPWRTFAAVIGIGAGMAVAASSLNLLAGFNRVLAQNFTLIDRSDVTVTFIEPLSARTVYDLGAVDGVIEVEPVRGVPAVLRHDRHSHRGELSGLVAAPRLYRPVNRQMDDVRMRGDGVILSTALADILEIRPGDRLVVDVREGRQPVLDLPVVAIADTLIGAPAYIELEALNRALKEPGRISGAYLRIDKARSEAIYETLKDMPGVAGVSLKAESRAAVEEIMDEGAGSMRFVMTVVAFVITFGIVYNSARIAYAERARDLASLRVIGFTRAEAAFVLLGELGIITVLALPVGVAMGWGVAQLLAAGFSTELYQIPGAFVPSAFGGAALAVLGAAVFSGWLVRRDLDRIDMVSALKTRE
ncbi:MAG: FtsX-like permease family protein [Alphaproteobacteria bacterium]|jgi:putative ABC transport system permease protein|nr:FtsX-like permease family protein [Alphaproteobacteria bacterium]